MSAQPVVVVTVSDRSAARIRADASGPAAIAHLRAAGLEATGDLVPDGIEAVAEAITRAVRSGARLVITTGGTGLGPRDLTPEATASVVERQVPGLAELLRADAISRTPHAALSRGVVGTLGQALVVNLPGKPSAVIEGLDVLLPLLPHALDQLSGGDH